MNAVAYETDSLAWRTRHAGALLGRCAGVVHRVLAIAAAVLLGGLGVLALVAIDKPERVSVGLFLCGLAVASLWGLWFSRLVLLHAEARQARIPGVPAAIAGTVALAFLATVAVPGLLLAAAGVRPGLGVCAMALAAAAGVLVATLPRIVYMLLCFAPLVLGLLHSLLQRLVPDAGALVAWRPELGDIAWLVPPVLVLAAWRWFAVVREAGGPARSPWRQPAITGNLQAGGGADNWLSGGALNAQLPDWMWPAGQTAGTGPHVPVRSMRALIGTPFAPLSGGQILVQLGMGAVALLYLLLKSSDTDAGVLAGGAIGGGAVMVVMYGQRLDAMYRKRAAELDELALLPGLGDADTRRRRLLAAVAYSPSWAMAVIVALLLGMGALMGIGAHMNGLLGMAGAGLALMTALGCLRPMSGKPMTFLWGLLWLVPGFVLVLVTVIAATHDGASAAPAIAAAWVLLYAILGAGLWHTWHRFRARPHPFLQP